MPDGPPPWPPRRLREDEAAYYVGLSASAFRVRCSVQPVRIGATVGWLREDLDAWLDRQRAGSAPSQRNPWHVP